jgi:hypothetical protein
MCRIEYCLGEDTSGLAYHKWLAIEMDEFIPEMEDLGG